MDGFARHEAPSLVGAGPRARGFVCMYAEGDGYLDQCREDVSANAIMWRKDLLEENASTNRTIPGHPELGSRPWKTKTLFAPSSVNWISVKLLTWMHLIRRKHGRRIERAIRMHTSSMKHTLCWFSHD